MKFTSDRRSFLKLSLASVVGITFGNKVLIKPAYADNLPHLKVDNPQARALKYTQQTQNNAQHCSNCALIQGNEDSEWRPCAIFPGKSVNANGWCSAWAKKP